MRTILQTLRVGILLGMLLTGSNALAQTATTGQPEQQSAASGQVLTRTPKAGQPERKIVTGCTELTRVKRESEPVRNSGHSQEELQPIDRNKKTDRVSRQIYSSNKRGCLTEAAFFCLVTIRFNGCTSIPATTFDCPSFPKHIHLSLL